MGKKKLKKNQAVFEGVREIPLSEQTPLQRAEMRILTLERLLAQTSVERDRLHKQIAEMELEKEAVQRCERTAVQAQLGHRAYIYKGMVAAAKQHILAERRVKELEAEVACFKSVRVAS